ncbi:hypothetical protein AVEN_144992-1 [Araneus ventricosus]|uniref:Uncharacterized protein n=1 Tax=Araneus ventricosus TaxID=182803 RepID=A0A4Y2KNV4_ARAVE|nr:hypothetical protein AVEN_144992-1 [Araneus ventricosus]
MGVVGTSSLQPGPPTKPPMGVVGTSSLQPGPPTKPFSSLQKKHLEGWYFETDGQVRQPILVCLHDLDADFSYAGFYKSVYR